MEIKLTESELQFLAEKYGGSGPKFQFTGSDQFTIVHPKATIDCEIIGFTNRTILIQYKLGFLKNLFVSWFVNFEMAGVIWNKKEKVITVDPFHFFPEKERIATLDFSIQEFSLEPGSLLIRIGIIPRNNEKTLQIASEGS